VYRSVEIGKCQQSLAHLQAKGLAINPEDAARLNPLGHKHINMLGRYTFALNAPLQSDGLRPLRGSPGSDEYLS
jgi:hypothetical protein